ncbi:MAG: [FeFe] hydrogenase H-cluster radical SAM maturase HydE [Bacteroidales bacterium]|nr:[FeFe] hydrogenase H-cluster radical SAM maturase HydE [Bacteroidales bacterium]
MTDSKLSTQTNIVTESKSSYGRNMEFLSDSDKNSETITNSFTDSIKTTSERKMSVTNDCTKEELVACLEERDSQKIDELLQSAYKVKAENIGKKVYLRGVIELSNICTKNCYFCGIRQLNSNIDRYELTEEQVIEASRFAWESGYGSLILKAGERCSKRYLNKVTKLIKSIKEISGGMIGITLSLGEQSKESYREWFDAGAHRYLLRIESSNPDLYARIHPKNTHHSWDRRVQAIMDLKDIGFQTGTGVMIGMPYQTTSDLADDLLFMKNIGVHMVGMGPYLKHPDTPMGKLITENQTLDLSLKMVALLRHMMPKINIAATTSMQVIDPFGRERAVLAGANIIMPNITPSVIKSRNKNIEKMPEVKDDASESKSKLENSLARMGIEIGWNEWGDSKAFTQGG